MPLSLEPKKKNTQRATNCYNVPANIKKWPTHQPSTVTEITTLKSLPITIPNESPTSVQAQ